jgi:hypothetical protein
MTFTLDSTRTTEDPPRREHDAAFEPVEPWIMLPSQTFGGAGAAALSGERRLMAAVLADALHLYLKHARGGSAPSQILFRETERWIESGDRSRLLSFENVCDVLEIDAGRLRRALYLHAASGIVRAIPFDVGRLRVSRGRKIRV